MEQRERSCPRNSVTIAAIVPIAQRKIRPRQRNLLRREKIHAIERCDDFAAREQLLQVVAMPKLFVAQDAEPKIRCKDFGLI